MLFKLTFNLNFSGFVICGEIFPHFDFNTKLILRIGLSSKFLVYGRNQIIN